MNIVFKVLHNLFTHSFIDHDVKSRWRLRGVVRSCFLFLLGCPVFSYIPAISFTRNKLLDIRKYTPPDISHFFVFSYVLLDIVVGRAALLFRRCRTHKRRKCKKEIRVAKRNYSGKVRIQLSSSDSSSVWKGLKEITNYKTPSPSTVENQQLADDLNEFYCRFEKPAGLCSLPTALLPVHERLHI